MAKHCRHTYNTDGTLLASGGSAVVSMTANWLHTLCWHTQYGMLSRLLCCCCLLGCNDHCNTPTCDSTDHLSPSPMMTLPAVAPWASVVTCMKIECQIRYYVYRLLLMNHMDQGLWTPLAAVTSRVGHFAPFSAVRKVRLVNSSRLCSLVLWNCYFKIFCSEKNWKGATKIRPTY